LRIQLAFSIRSNSKTNPLERLGAMLQGRHYRTLCRAKSDFNRLRSNLLHWLSGIQTALNRRLYRASPTNAESSLQIAHEGLLDFIASPAFDQGNLESPVTTSDKLLNQQGVETASCSRPGKISLGMSPPESLQPKALVSNSPVTDEETDERLRYIKNQNQFVTESLNQLIDQYFSNHEL
jgi:hypothetical protein